MIFQGYPEFKRTLPLACGNSEDVHYSPLTVEEETEAWGGPGACVESQQKARSLSASPSYFQ